MLCVAYFVWVSYFNISYVCAGLDLHAFGDKIVQLTSSVAHVTIIIAIIVS